MAESIPGAVAGPSTPAVPSPAPAPTSPFIDRRGDTLAVRTFRDEDTDLGHITRLCEEELSEPYNVYTFRYFLSEWPHLTFFVYPSASDPTPIATIICKQDTHRERTNRGYIGMLSVQRAWRRRGIARRLVELAIDEMEARGAQEIVLETEFDNNPSLTLYEKLGFVREKRLHRFYSNGKDAFRLILPLASYPGTESEEADRGRWLVAQGPDSSDLDYILAGPQEMPDMTAGWPDVSRLTLVPPSQRARPDYII
ncbi:N-alpha-acetyltransferase 30 [Vanrija pseudolonga]|uniref:N-alpha-acetyltransferase 30 n=1 Tax=Vanrija pseudolonga TaxID=143232 RepID=A0AAF0Y3Y3_9TREE|nr:N-alpha-acetyltransferase 30 [Vanrija pseudolonga]